MTDVLSRKQRSRVMAAVRSKGNTATELKIISIFRAHGIKGWRRNQQLPGRPDFVFRRERLAVFVDGCFWHGCRWHCRMPKSRKSFWIPKIARNKTRDQEVGRLLRRRCWGVLRVWEHALSRPGEVATRIQVKLATRSKRR